MELIIFIIAVFILLLYLICPTLRKHPDKVLLRQMFIAHRGLHSINDGVPENSLPAFALAVKKGYPIEIDIHLTADGKVVVFHDDDLKRVCGVEKRVEALSLEELKKLRLSQTAEQIPTLEECLRVVDGKVPLLIEYKCDYDTCNALCEAAAGILNEYKGKYFVQSFYPPVLGWYRTNKKDILRGQLSSTFKTNKSVSLGQRLLGCLLFNFISRPDFIAYDYRYPQNIFRRINVLLGAGSAAWTFRSKEEFEKYKKYYETYIFEGFEPESQKK